MNSTASPKDELSDADDGADQNDTVETESNSRKIWLRLLFMVLLVFLYGVSRVVVSAVIVLQFFWVVFTEKPNERLTKFGQSLATYTYQILRYLTFNCEERPFPFAGWPRGTPN